MRIAAVLPHVEIFGGVRRYIEIGNEFVKRGHAYTLFHPEGTPPEWLKFVGRVRAFSSLEEESFDVALCSEYSVLSEFERIRARVKFFYFLLPGHKKERDVVRSGYFFLGNSLGMCRRIEKKYRVLCFRATGGVNPDIFYPVERQKKSDRFRILSYGRLSRRRKGIQHVLRAVEKLHRKFPHIQLLLFDSRVGEEKKDPRKVIKTDVPYEFFWNLPQEKMAWLYSQADVFVSAERRAGWSNTAAEAMACGIPVVCTPSGTQDFAVHGQTALVVRLPYSPFLCRQLRRFIQDESLRNRIAQEGFRRIKTFTWSALAERLESHFTAVMKLK